MAIKTVADSLSEGTSSFATDDDPQLDQGGTPVRPEDARGAAGPAPDASAAAPLGGGGLHLLLGGVHPAGDPGARGRRPGPRPRREGPRAAHVPPGARLRPPGAGGLLSQPPAEPDGGPEGGAGEDQEEGRARSLLDRGRVGLGDLARQGPDGPGRRRPDRGRADPPGARAGRAVGRRLAHGVHDRLRKPRRRPGRQPGSRAHLLQPDDGAGPREADLAAGLAGRERLHHDPESRRVRHAARRGAGLRLRHVPGDAARQPAGAETRPPAQGARRVALPGGQVDEPHPSTVVRLPRRARAGGCRSGARPGSDRARRTAGQAPRDQGRHAGARRHPVARRAPGDRRRSGRRPPAARSASRSSPAPRATRRT